MPGLLKTVYEILAISLKKKIVKFLGNVCFEEIFVHETSPTYFSRLALFLELSGFTS